MDTLRPVGPITEAHLDEVERLFGQTWWTRDRTRDDIAVMLAGSPVTVGLFDATGRLRAFARAFSDGIYKALVMDVIVEESLRGHGQVGHQLMTVLLAHPLIVGIPDVELYCHPDRERFYRALGFTTAVVGGGEGVGAVQTLMRLDRVEGTQQAA